MRWLGRLTGLHIALAWLALSCLFAAFALAFRLEQDRHMRTLAVAALSSTRPRVSPPSPELAAAYDRLERALALDSGWHANFDALERSSTARQRDSLRELLLQRTSALSAEQMDSVKAALLSASLLLTERVVVSLGTTTLIPTTFLAALAILAIGTPLLLALTVAWFVAHGPSQGALRAAA